MMRFSQRILDLTKHFVCSYTAVGVFVLSRVFREAWGTKALEKQSEFNDFLEVFPLIELLNNPKFSFARGLFSFQKWLAHNKSFSPRKVACAYLWNL